MPSGHLLCVYVMCLRVRAEVCCKHTCLRLLHAESRTHFSCDERLAALAEDYCKCRTLSAGTLAHALIQRATMKPYNRSQFQEANITSFIPQLSPSFGPLRCFPSCRNSFHVSWLAPVLKMASQSLYYLSVLWSDLFSLLLPVSPLRSCFCFLQSRPLFCHMLSARRCQLCTTFRFHLLPS